VKSVRLVSRPPPDLAPRPFTLLADSAFVTETRLLDWNLAAPETVTGLFVVDGDGERLAAELREEAVVTSVDAERLADDRWVVLVQLRSDAISLLEQVLGSVSRPGLVLTMPVVYRDGRVHVRLVGADDALQAMLDGLPDAIDIDVRAVETFRPERAEPGAALSERQRAAVDAALELGYYDTPRQATHADVADRLGCAPSTASEHLQRAEAKLARATSDGVERQS